MAYAAITKNLIVEVESKIRMMRNAELRPLPTPDSIEAEIKADPCILQLCIDKAWAPVADLRDRLEPYGKTVRFGIRFKHTLDGDAAPTEVTINLGDHKGPCIINKGEDYYSHAKYIAIVPVDAHPRAMEMFTCKQALNECNNRWYAVNAQVVKFLQNCKSANEAIKLWPDVVRYLPKEAIDKVNLKTEKAIKGESNALEALEALDFDSINASTVLARMAGAHV